MSRVPTYQLQAFQIATMPIPGWEIFFGKNDTQFYPLSYYVWVVKGNGLTGIIDTGLPIKEKDRKRLQEIVQLVDGRCVYTDIILLDKLYEKVGLKPESIDFVLITQAITYHSGGLCEELMPRAHVYISKTGMLELLLEEQEHPPQDLYFTEAAWCYFRKLLLEHRLHLVDDPTEVAPGLTFETTGGHHPGSAGVRAQTSLGIVGILETAFLQQNIDEVHPVGVAENVMLCRKAIRQYKQQCEIVLADHDPSILQRFPGGLIR